MTFPSSPLARHHGRLISSGYINGGEDALALSYPPFIWALLTHPCATGEGLGGRCIGVGSPPFVDLPFSTSFWNSMDWWG